MGFDTQELARKAQDAAAFHWITSWIFFSDFPEEWEAFLGISREIP
jgi:hypothetical protein